MSTMTETILYRSGSDGYHTYRIPALVTTKAGTVLAFCEGRRNGAGDTGDIDLLVKRSVDGGMTWSALRHDPVLVEPICQAGLISYAPGDKEKGNWLVFSNPASQKGRVDMTVRLSRDGGETWPAAKRLHAGPSAYSDLTVLPNGDIAVMYESGDDHPYEEIRFATLSLKDLEESK